MYVQVQWIKLAVFFYKDEKIRLIRKLPDGDSIALMFIMLLALAGDRNEDGDIPFTGDELSTLFDIPLNTVKLGLTVMLDKGMLEEENGILHITNWEKYQSVEGMEKIRAKGRERVRKFRERQRCISDMAESSALPSADAASPQFAPLLNDDEADQLRTDHDEILDAAKAAGFPENIATMNKLIEFYGIYGKSPVLEGINACVMAGNQSLFYLEACCKKGKPQGNPQATQVGSRRRDGQGREIWD